MGRLHLAVGTRYERDGRAFLVVQVLRDGRLLVEDQSGGGQAVVTREELTAAWDGGALRFMVRGLEERERRGCRRHTRSPISTCCRKRRGRRRGGATR